jgi:Flp pilus assembly protein TadG
VFGFAVVMVLLLFAVQVIFDLYARSVVTSATVEAAHAVADYGTSGSSMASAEAAAEAHAQSQLGGYARQAQFSWASPPPPGEVELTASFEMGGSSFDLFRLPFLDHFSRTVRVRVERIQCPAGATCTTVP